MNKKLLDYLVCLLCKEELNINIVKQESNEIIEGNLQCGKCLKVFSIANGIPIMILEDLKDEKKKTSKFIPPFILILNLAVRFLIDLGTILGPINRPYGILYKQE